MPYPAPRLIRQGGSDRLKIRIVHVAGARPNFMKIAPVMASLSKYPTVEQYLVHTGQHYDEMMSGAFFDDLGMPQSDVNLGVG